MKTYMIYMTVTVDGETADSLKKKLKEQIETLLTVKRASVTNVIATSNSKEK